MNIITLIGNLGRDSELRKTETGRDVLSFSVACSRSYKVQNEWKTETTWFDVCIWGDRARKLQSALTKGTKVFVYGEIRQRNFLSSLGHKRTAYEVVAEKIHTLVSTPSGSSSGGSKKDEESQDLMLDQE